MKIVRCPECGNLQQTDISKYNNFQKCFIRKCAKCEKMTFHSEWEYIEDEFKGNFFDERV